MRYLVIALWLCVMIWLQQGRPYGSSAVETDWHGCYGPQAELVWSGIIPIDDFRGPLYQITLGLISYPLQDTFRVAQWYNIALVLCLLFLIYAIMNQLEMGERSKLIATLALLLTPAFIEATVFAGTDMFFLCIVVATIYAIMQRRDILTGVLISAALLTRANGIALAFPALLMFRWRWVPIVISSFIAWGMYTKFQVGEFFYNLNYLNTATFGIPDSNIEIFWYDRIKRPDGWLAVLTDTAILKGLLINTQEVISGLLTKLLYFPLSVLAIYGLSIRDDFGASWFWILAYSATMFLVWVDVRFYLPLLPFLAIGVASSCEKLLAPRYS